MSTRSLIGVHNKVDDTVDCVYCHFDGHVDHPTGVGQMLRIHYNTLEKAKEVLELGDLSSLEETVDKCVAYHRDRGDDIEDCKSRNIRLTEYHKDILYADNYDYLYLLKEDTDDGYVKWFYQTENNEEGFKLVTADLAK